MSSKATLAIGATLILGILFLGGVGGHAIATEVWNYKMAQPTPAVTFVVDENKELIPETRTVEICTVP